MVNSQGCGGDCGCDDCRADNEANFVSEQQRKYLWSQEPDIAEAWAHGEHTSDKDHHMPSGPGSDVKGPVAEKARERKKKREKAENSRIPQQLSNSNPEGFNQYKVSGGDRQSDRANEASDVAEKMSEKANDKTSHREAQWAHEDASASHMNAMERYGTAAARLVGSKEVGTKEKVKQALHMSDMHRDAAKRHDAAAEEHERRTQLKAENSSMVPQQIFNAFERDSGGRLSADEEVQAGLHEDTPEAAKERQEKSKGQRPTKNARDDVVKSSVWNRVLDWLTGNAGRHPRTGRFLAPGEGVGTGPTHDAATDAASRRNGFENDDETPNDDEDDADSDDDVMEENKCSMNSRSDLQIVANEFDSDEQREAFFGIMKKGGGDGKLGGKTSEAMQKTADANKRSAIAGKVNKDRQAKEHLKAAAAHVEAAAAHHAVGRHSVAGNHEKMQAHHEAKAKALTGNAAQAKDRTAPAKGVGKPGDKNFTGTDVDELDHEEEDDDDLVGNAWSDAAREAAAAARKAGGSVRASDASTKAMGMSKNPGRIFGRNPGLDKAGHAVAAVAHRIASEAHADAAEGVTGSRHEAHVAAASAHSRAAQAHQSEYANNARVPMRGAILTTPTGPSTSDIPSTSSPYTEPPAMTSTGPALGGTTEQRTFNMDDEECPECGGDMVDGECEACGYEMTDNGPSGAMGPENPTERAGPPRPNPATADVPEPYSLPGTLPPHDAYAPSMGRGGAKDTRNKNQIHNQLYGGSDMGRGITINRVTKTEAEWAADAIVANAARAGFKLGRKLYVYNDKGVIVRNDGGPASADAGKSSTVQAGGEEDDTATTDTTFPSKRGKGLEGGGVKTMNQWLATVPPEYRDVVVNGIQRNNSARSQIIEQLTGHIENADQKNRMVANFSRKSLGELQDYLATFGGVVNSASFPTDNSDFNFLGAAGGPLVNVGSGDDQSEVMVPPTLNYAEMAEERAAGRKIA